MVSAGENISEVRLGKKAGFFWGKTFLPAGCFLAGGHRIVHTRRSLARAGIF